MAILVMSLRAKHGNLSHVIASEAWQSHKDKYIFFHEIAALPLVARNDKSTCEIATSLCSSQRQINLRDYHVTSFLAMTNQLARLPRHFVPRMYESAVFVN
jgi:hypothetical protein